MKYIMFRTNGIDQFVIFSSLLCHAEVARSLGAEQVVSAGFVSFEGDCPVHCYGASATLGVESRGAADASKICAYSKASLLLPP